MEKEKLIIDIIRSSTSNLPSNVIRNDITLNKIPFDFAKNTGLISSEDYELIKPYIDEFGLDDPKKLVKWLIDLHFASIESINDGIASIRNDFLTNDIQDILAIKDNMSELSSSDNLSHWSMQYTNDINKCLRRLEGKIKGYISEIRRIDDLPRYKFFLQANFNKSKVTSNVQMIKAALKAYLEALNIYAVLANERHGDKSDKKNNYLEEKMNFIMFLDISLVYAYDKYKDSDLLNSSRLKKRIDDIKSISDKLNEYLIAEQETEVDFENDIKY